MDISIRTAQHVNIVYQPAGLVNRIGATLIRSEERRVGKKWNTESWQVQ